MEEFQFKMINTFNTNFNWIDIAKILKLYEKDKKEHKYLHPLFTNYNYCLFCGTKAKTKYYTKNLEDSHIQLKDKTIGEYLLNNKITLKQIKNKKVKLTKRRFIHSYENISNNLKTIIKEESDTEFYVHNSIKKIKRKKVILHSNLSKKIPEQIIKLNNFDEIKIIKRVLTNDNIDMKKKEFIKKPKKKLDYYNYDFEDNISKGKSSLFNNSSERKMIDDFSKNEKEFNIDKSEFNLEQEEAKTSANNESLGKNNCIFDIKENIEFNYKKAKSTVKSSKILQNINGNNLIESSIFNFDKEKNKNNDIYSQREEDKSIKKNNKVLNILNGAKAIFGFGKRNSLPINSIRRNAITNNYPNLKKLAKIKTFKENKLECKFKQKKLNKYSEKNDNCSICFQEIKEKFTLLCGDFFCRDCLRTKILTAMETIINLDKLKCIICNENLEENSIKKLLTDEEFQKYRYLMTKITGLKCKEYIPCPYPDCPGWADESQSNHNDIVFCQYGHDFCKLCLLIVDINELQEKKHKCFENISEEEKKTKEFFKKNKSFRKCPNCKSMVVREGGGCNNMTCTNAWCGYEFCWICNKKYDDMHYKNFLSMCFGLAETNSNERLVKYSRVRFCRCLLIFMLIIFIILPFIIVFFSTFEAVLYIITFVLDGSAMKNIKLKSSYAHKLFYKIVYGFFLSIGIAYIPIGYISLALLIIFAPIVFVINKIRQKNDEELD